ncbi:MAG: putative sulfate exporter family transporter [Saprospiraceae bacterium]|nr:putative sulfate exporter family transporter [Saprospiraceae bacterium]
MTSTNDSKSRFNFTEDHWSLIIAGTMVLIVLAMVFTSVDFAYKPPVYSWSTIEDLGNKVFAKANWSVLVMLSIAFAVLASKAIDFDSVGKYAAGFLILFLLALLSLVIAGNQVINSYGIEYVVFALLIGLIIRNLKLAPSWLLSVARSELYIKSGLVILGTSVLFTDIVKAGLPGIIQAIVVVLVVWFVSMWISRRLHVDDEFAVMIASAVSICGVSAAIVASGAINGDKKKLSYVTTLVLLIAIPMLIIQPWLIKIFQIPEIIGGAWLGGTLDTTASVTAASQLVGPIATKAGVIVKFSQNVLIGFAALFISIWWSYRNNSKENTVENKWKTIWDRFPKFVLGFIVASLVFSFLIPTDTSKQIGGFLNGIRTLWFALAFVSIGLEANFKDLFTGNGLRPAWSFVLSQLFNIIWTLLWAYILFGGYILPIPDIK